MLLLFKNVGIDEHNLLKHEQIWTAAKELWHNHRKEFHIEFKQLSKN